MKKLISIVMAMVMTVAIGINVLAAESTDNKPEIKVYTSAVPTKNGDTAKFTVKLTNFDDVKGVKLTITAEDGVTFNTIESTDLTLTKDSNYKLSSGKIVITDLTKTVKNATITVTATATADAKITLVADLAKDGKNLYTKGEFTLTDGTLLVKPSEKSATACSTLKESVGYFIPYGSLGYTDGDNFVSIDKNKDGSFTVPQNVTANYYQYKKADNGVMTFGISDKINDNAYQFGSWVDKTKGTEYGTMVIAGEYTEILNYFKNNKNYTEKEFIELLSNKYNELKVENAKYVNMKCTVNNTDRYIRVYKFKNTTKMWESETERQFALQIYNVQQNEEYVGIAYSVNGETTTFSETAQYVKHESK